MRKIRLGTKRNKQVVLLASIAALFIITGIVVLLVNDAPIYVVLATVAFLVGLVVILTAFLGILFMQRSAVNRMRTQMRNLSKRLTYCQSALQETTENVNALTASQTRLWDDFERSNNPQITLKK